MAAVAGGSKQAIIVVNDNSAGNDAIICDESITSIADLKGKTIAAEEGVVDHFLLLQGLADGGHDPGRHRLPRRAHRRRGRGFAGGQFDCVGVFAPFTLEALEAPGLARGVQLEGLPRHHPRPHRGVAERWWRSSPKVVQKIVDAWYETLDYIEANPDEALKIMADKADVSTAEYEDFAERHEALHRRRGARGVRSPVTRTTSLEYTARLDQPVPRRVGPHQEGGLAQGPVRTAVHAGLRRPRRDPSP